MWKTHLPNEAWAGDSLFGREDPITSNEASCVEAENLRNRASYLVGTVEGAVTRTSMVESRWRNPQKVVHMDPYIKDILGVVPSTLNPL